MPLATRGYYADADEAGFETVPSSAFTEDHRKGRLSFHARPYLPDNKKFHQQLDQFGVGEKYREYKSYLQYLGTKGEVAEVGLDLAEGLASSYL